MICLGLLLSFTTPPAWAQQSLTAPPSPWNWRAWMFSGGSERLTQPDQQAMGLGAYVGRTLGDGGLIAGFRFGATDSDNRQTRSAMFSLTLPLNPVREPVASRPVTETLGWRSAIAAPVMTAPPDPIMPRLIDPTLRLPALDPLLGRDDPLAIGRVGLDLLSFAAPLM